MTGAVEDAIRCGGLAKIKVQRIKVLGELSAFASWTYGFALAQQDPSEHHAQLFAWHG